MEEDKIKLPIYLDNGATTRVDEDVAEKIKDILVNKYGNPSSLHSYGIEAENMLEEARKVIKDSINAKDEDQLIFTGGATEADNIAILGIARYYKNDKKNHIITTKIEHPAINDPSKELIKEGFKVDFLKVDNEGFIDIEDLKSKINDKTIFVSVIHANHEIGTIQDIKEIGKICRENNVLFHVDAAQSYTKILIDVQKMNIDLISLNAHKIHGPKGIGALFIKNGIKFKKLVYGGPQEGNLRAGTENMPFIIGFSEAVKNQLDKFDENVKKITELRDYLIDKILEIDGTHLNGPRQNRVCHNVNISFDSIEGESLLMFLDMQGICVSTGSACSSKSLTPSRVLTSIGRNAVTAHGSIRFTLSKYNTKKEIDYVVEKVKEAVEKLRNMSPLNNKNKVNGEK